MSLLYFLADSFIKAFGITQPNEKTRKQAAFLILGLILVAITAMATIAYVIHLTTG